MIAGWLTGLVSLFLASVSDAQTTYAQTIHQDLKTESKVATTPDKPNNFTDGKAEAQKPSLRVYKYNKDGVVSFSDRAPMRTRYEVVTYSCFACNPASTVDWYSIKLDTNAYTYPIDVAARKHAVDPALVRAVIHAESAFRESVISRKGAVGLMQLMPKTAQDMGVKDSLSPTQNIHGGVKYLAYLLKLFDGSVILASAAYNAGPGAVKRHQGIPPYAETQAYVKRVKILHKRYKEALAAIDLDKASHQASNL
jgi:soluble lytic murein transglycosylase-like protein